MWPGDRPFSAPFPILPVVGLRRSDVWQLSCLNPHERRRVRSVRKTLEETLVFPHPRHALHGALQEDFSITRQKIPARFAPESPHPHGPRMPDPVLRPPSGKILHQGMPSRYSAPENARRKDGRPRRHKGNGGSCVGHPVKKGNLWPRLHGVPQNEKTNRVRTAEKPRTLMNPAMTSASELRQDSLPGASPYDDTTALRYRDTALLLAPMPASAWSDGVQELVSSVSAGVATALGLPCPVVILADGLKSPGPVSPVGEGPTAHPSNGDAHTTRGAPSPGGFFPNGRLRGQASPEKGIVVHPTPAEAAALFRCAHAFLALWPSPYLETWLMQAALFQVPVLTGPKTPEAVRGLLGDAEVHLQTGEPLDTLAILRVFLSDRSLRRRTAEAQLRRFQHLHNHTSPMCLDYLVDGPFETSYSLALVNREGARALERRHPGRVGLDFLGRPEAHPRLTPGGLDRHPDLADLFHRGHTAPAARVVLWNSYPPYVAGRPGLVNVLHSYGWEETVYPQEYIARFARCLDGVTVMSRAVRKILIDNGLPLPIRVSGLGVDHITRTSPIPYDGDLGRGFRFLYISSGFPRKGVDILLHAYGKAFTGADDVTLVIKTFPNPHNRVHDWVRAFRERHPDPPRVIVIDADLPDGMIRDLYRRCHAFVAPTRGEGFGLPMAEAMLEGLPVIVTDGSGQADFCTPRTAWCVPARWTYAASHLSRPGSLWLEPDPDSLAETMRTVAAAGPEAVRARCEAARQFVTRHMTWDAWARRTEQAVEVFQRPQPWRHRPIPLVWVSTWGGRCGIARYSQYLLTPMLSRPGAVKATVLAPSWESPLVPDPPFVRRCPQGPEVVDSVLAGAEDTGAAVAVIQYHPAFYDADRLLALVDALSRRGILVWVTFHAVHYVAEVLRGGADVLKKAARLAVHTVDDVNFFREAGLDDNTVLWPHGLPLVPRQSVEAAKRRFGLERFTVLATFGFLMPHKGVLELLQAFQKLLARFFDLFLVLATARYPTDDSARHAEEVRQAIHRMGLERRVLFLEDFLEEEAALALLQAADLVVYPYQYTGESSSAAVRFGIAAGRPTACTPLRIFDDVAPVVHTLPGTDPTALAQGIGELLADAEKRASREEAQQRWIVHNAWPALADRMERVLRALLVNASVSDEEIFNDDLPPPGA